MLRARARDAQVTYRAVDDMLIARIIIDVYRYPPQRRYFRGEFIKTGIVLLFALVGLRHCCGLLGAPGLSFVVFWGLRRLYAGVCTVA